MFSPKCSLSLFPPGFAGYLYGRIHVDGRVFFCCENIDVGHVDDADFATLWTAPSWQAVRDRLHAGRYYPGCRRCGKFDMNHDAALALAALTAGAAHPDRQTVVTPAPGEGDAARGVA